MSNTLEDSQRHAEMVGMSNKKQDKPASKEYVLEMLAFTLDWQTQYMQAVSMNDEQQTISLLRQWEEFMNQEKTRL